MSLSVFISYAHEDEALLRELENHLAMLRNQGIITTWNDRNISAGTEWEREIDMYLNSAQLILLLISANFLASPYCYSIELKRAIERHNAGEVRVIPIILRSADWKNAPFGKLQALPRSGKPIVGQGGRSGRDRAFLEVIFGIREAIETMNEMPLLNPLTLPTPVVSTARGINQVPNDRIPRLFPPSRPTDVEDPARPPLLTIPTGTVTFLLIDIEDSTRLWQQHAEATKMAHAHYSALLPEMIAAHKGSIFKTVGDAMYTVFVNVAEALTAALAAQRAIQAKHWDGIGPLRARMVLHTGFTEIQESDYVGPTLNHATQLLSAGHGSQILLSFVAGELVRDVLPTGVSLRDLGEYHLTNLVRPEHIFQIVASDLPSNFPPLRTQSSRSHNLPVQPTTLIGRKEELTTLFTLLQRADVRLVTLCGPGGIGKTRLALQAAEEQLETFTDGVYFVPLAPVSSADFLISTIADVLQLSLYDTGSPKMQLLDYLRKKRLLLVLDNFEHLLDGGELVADIIQQAASVVILVTSQERLNVEGEWVMELSGLLFPPGNQHADGQTYSAMQLFLQSAGRAQIGFTISSEDLPAVVRICQLVEGMPLAIELAAAWVRVISCVEIVQEIERGLAFLPPLSWGATQRHRSMRAVFDHSWSLLSSEEQRVFRQLSVFRGGFRRDAAEQVIGTTLMHLAALVDKSLMRRGATGRYDMHELIRQYAAMKLQETPEEQVVVLDRHCDYYSQFLQQRRMHLRGKLQRVALDELRPEIENIRQAWRWAVSQQKIPQLKQSLRSLLDFYNIQGWFQEGAEAFRLVIEELEDEGEGTEEPAMQQDIVRGQALAGLGWFYLASGRYEQGSDVLQTSLNLLRRYGALGELINPLTSLGMAAHIMGDYTRSRQFLQESLTIQQASGDRWGEGWTLGNLGVVAHALGEYQEADRLIREALKLFKTVGDQRLTEICGSFLARVACAQGNYAEAQDLSRQSLRLSREIDHLWGIGLALGALGTAIYYMGDPLEAYQLLQESLALLKTTGETWGITITLSSLAHGTYASGAYQEARRYALEALEVAWGAKIVPLVLDALVVVAQVRVAKGERESALEVLGHSLEHLASSAGTREKAGRLLAELENSVAPQVMAAIKDQWTVQTLEKVVGKVLEAEGERQ